MTNRVLFGQRGAAYGLWVSKPGFDVLSTADANMMMLPSQANLQLIQSGYIDTSGNAFPYTVVIPNLGYFPLVKWVMSGYNAYLVSGSATTIRFYSDGQAAQSGVARFISYQIFSEPLS
ncbi:hypothetical protein HJA82_29115 [Rhizobium bangladeshense]|uniref:hypothetical protein n=1 Tax=Rhizobium bangladeshense TaxID=1138189 RepID=UPI001C839D1B|nr:hypothetical protein [Rhizobium bangladeshense]MBX4911375.1 hypothetical protein [Rhizobium bangladeshense]